MKQLRVRARTPFKKWHKPTERAKQIHQMSCSGATSYAYACNFDLHNNYLNDLLFPCMEVCVDELHPGPPYESGGPLDVFKVVSPLAKVAYCAENTYSSRFFCSFDRWPHTIGMPTVTYQYLNYVPHPEVVRRLPEVFYKESSQRALIEGRGPESPSLDYKPASDWGAKGWNMYKPLKPGVDLSTFTGELRELPRMLRTTASTFHKMWKGDKSVLNKKELASNWLNYQFGWLPFLSDLRKFYKTVKTIDRRMNRLRHYNGQWERRGGTVEETVESGDLSNPNVGSGHWTPYWDGDSDNEPAEHSLTYELKRKVWFVGKFRYYIPELKRENLWTWRYQAAKQFGLIPSPSTVWNLTPWSWLIDWCSNAGDVISNLVTSTDFAAKYAYVMAHTKYEAVLDSRKAFCYVPRPDDQRRWVFTYEHKARSVADPFGFSVDWDDFTPRQLSILAALGITRRAT